MRKYEKESLTDEQIIARSEAAEQFSSPTFSAKGLQNPDGTYSADKFALMGPTCIPARRIDAQEIIDQFDKPNDLTWFPDFTPAGKQVGTQIVVHKEHEAFMKRRMEIAQEVYEANGIYMGDPDRSTFVSFEEMARIQKEIEQRHTQELASQN